MTDYTSLFNVTREQMRNLLSTALSSGGDYADLFFEHSISESMRLRDGMVNSAGCDIDFGVGIRVVAGGHTGYAFSESTAYADMEKAARSAAAIASSPFTKGRQVEMRPTEFRSRYRMEGSWDDFSVERRKEYLMQLDEMIKAADGRIVKVFGSLSNERTQVMFCNSLGDFFCELRPMCSLVATCIARQGTTSETVTFSRSHRCGSEMLTPALQRRFADEIAAKIRPLFEARRPKGGEMAVVMGAGSSGILLHEAVGHAFEADFNRKGISIFSDKMGCKVCSDNISIVDDATVEGNRGAVSIDDEGVPGQKTYMVRNGVLESYLHDRISATHYGVAPTGNGRRESFRFNPIPRMRATYMEGGQGTAEDIIRSCSNGIYVDNFTNGQVQIGAGDFTFFVKSGYLIEDGRLTAPIKDINIIGNGPQAIADIREVADDCTIDDSTWTCGKDQSCYVSCGMPTVLVSRLTVGGGN